MKKVSVIVPVYRVEKYIAATVRSVLEQTYPNFELLIVDDGSPDRSDDICQQFLDPRIKIIRQPNRGASAARNAGIRQAQGEYLAFLDGDDLWLPQKLAKHVEHLDRSPAVGLSFSRSAFISEAGERLDNYQMPKLKAIAPQDFLLGCNLIGNGSAPVIRREVLNAIKFQEDGEACYFNPQFFRAEDLECWLRIVIQTPWQIEGIPEALTLYRVNSEGLSANLLEQLKAWEQVIDKTRSYAPELLAQWENPARAYHLWYLARRAVRLQNGSLAVQFSHQALAAYWQLLFKEPRRTLLTWAAAYSLWLLPRSFYRQIEELALKTTGATQKSRIDRDLLGEST
ncbi:glycosyltransferase family 2 protein [Pleurocapsales cyanobacterium LEGE 10410]|nr:glycosyltransferase family 2 protein [Pleurocapsales cyanobacterium LEGE 10410]